MGIKNYLTNILETFPNIVSPNQPKNIEILAIDLNSILHNICPKTKNLKEFENKLILQLNKILKKIKPKEFYIFTDGQAVLAKAKTQINRRQKYLYSECKGISTLNLTPGTIFMNQVDNIIEKYLKKLDIITYYSSSKENNEGELKMFKYLNCKENYNKKICIYGDDSDLIVLSLMNTPILNLSIYNNFKFISLFKLVANLSYLSEVKFNFNNHPIRKDFALISLFLGNDYNKSISTFKNLLNAYKIVLSKKNGFLLNINGHLNLRNLKILLENLPNEINCNLHSNIDVKNYFNCIIWNLNLYNNFTIPNFIPKYSINIKTILKYFPEKLKIEKIQPKWLNKDVYLLLLMPVTGKELIPKHLQKHMEHDSIIKDLFPEPCNICINFKNKINQLNSDSNIEENQLKALLYETNKKYRTHLDDFHPDNDLQIDRITSALNCI